MAADERETSSPSRAGSGVDEPMIGPTREGYDLWSQTHDDEDNPLIALEEAPFERLRGEVRGLTIADIGCGTGRHALAMAQSGAHVVALDFSLGTMRMAPTGRWP
jgi:2-polyprenyl-3-methyl-5-hydroxy-6-metoxy-1,4-benzoquinol methylase